MKGSYNRREKSLSSVDDEGRLTGVVMMVAAATAVVAAAAAAVAQPQPQQSLLR